MIREYELAISEQALELINFEIDYYKKVPNQERNAMWLIDKRWYMDIDTKKYYEDYFPILKKWNKQKAKELRKDLLVLDMNNAYISQVIKSNADAWIRSGKITAENAHEYAYGNDLEFLLTTIADNQKRA